MSQVIIGNNNMILRQIGHRRQTNPLRSLQGSSVERGRRPASENFLAELTGLTAGANKNEAYWHPHCLVLGGGLPEKLTNVLYQGKKMGSAVDSFGRSTAG